jgi:hypothetical protein
LVEERSRIVELLHLHCEREAFEDGGRGRVSVGGVAFEQNVAPEAMQEGVGIDLLALLGRCQAFFNQREHPQRPRSPRKVLQAAPET